jgi:tetratricopeptide (TPR) repeat protein
MKDNRMRASHRTLGSFMGILLSLALAIAPPFIEVAAAQSDDLAVQSYIVVKRDHLINTITTQNLKAAITEVDGLVSYANSELPAGHWARNDSGAWKESLQAAMALPATKHDSTRQLFRGWRRCILFLIDGEHESVAEEADSVLKLSRDLGLDDTMLHLEILAVLTRSYLESGRHSEAAEYCNCRLAILAKHRLGVSDPAIRARLDRIEVLMALGPVFDADIECARAHQVLIDLQKLPHDRYHTDYNLGILAGHRALQHFGFSEFGEAEKCYSAVLRLSQRCEMLITSPATRASLIITIAHCKALGGKVDEAVGDLGTYDELIKSVKAEFQVNNWVDRIRRAEIMTLAGRFDEAASDLRMAEELIRIKFGPTSKHVARHQFGTALLQIARGELATGRATLRQCVDYYLADGVDPSLIRILVVAEKEEKAEGNLERAGELAAIRTRLERRVAEHRQAMNAEFGSLTRLQATQALPASTPATAAVRPLPSTVAPASAARPGTAPRTR